MCGGPSLERGISLNSARSILDFLENENVEIAPIFFDLKKNAFQIPTAQIYSNTPADFDFNLKKVGKKLSRTALTNFLKKCDLTFPAIHGAFGEDGELQKFLQKNGINFIGADFDCCKKSFDKFSANQILQKNGFKTLPIALLKIFEKKENEKILKKFFAENKISRAIVKPAAGGSSIGVFSVSNFRDALEKAEIIFKKRIGTRVVVEPFCDGAEFTIVVLQNRFGTPVSLIPSEIEADYENHQIFDFRKKYLPTRQVFYHCPPRFSNEEIEKIQIRAEQIFQLFGFRDFARFDGFVTKNGEIIFSDLNPISGMEQNSFLFQQAARVGFSHAEVLNFIAKSAAARGKKNFPEITNLNLNSTKKEIPILFGGATSERQV